MDWGVILLISTAILAVAILAGGLALSRTRGTERGSLPGTGDHVIEVNYNSGAGGGAQTTTYRIPKDPQDYAKLFIPREKRK